MRALAIALSFILFFAPSAQAQDATIEDVISAQIEAFQQDDVETAFSFASPNIQRLFGTPENFGTMVQNGYPMVWRPADVAFVKQRIEGGVTYQVMRFIDMAGLGHSFVYEMVQVEGAWKINGVYRVPSNDVNV